jgi:hypothetical protein
MPFQLKKKKLIGRSGRCSRRKLARRHQYSSRRHGDVLCFARWTDGSEALLGSDQISDRIGSKSVSSRLRAPQGAEKEVQYKTIISFIFVLSQSIFTRNTISIQFEYKNFSLLVSFQVFKFHV